MQFLIYSEVDERSIRDRLGKPEYSYYFVLRTFRPVLEQLGNVVAVRKPLEEVDPLYEACVARGEPCVFICFSPPNSVPLGLKCPTTVVFAWEFTTLPDGAWDPGNPRSDWHYVLRTLGHAICLSGHTARVVKAEMGADFPVFPIACAVWDRIVKDAGVRITDPAIDRRELRIRGTIIDTATLTLAPEMIFAPGFPPSEVAEQPPEESPPEVAEALPEEAPPELVMPEPVAELVVEAEPRRGIRFRLAVTKRHAIEWYREAVRDLVPGPLRWLISRFGILGERLYRLLTGRTSAALDEPVLPEAPPQAEAPEPELPQEPVPTPEPAPQLQPELAVEVGGIVYTSVLNPADGRKNWQDMVTGFCWAFRDVPDATLILKMIRSGSRHYRHELFIMLAQLAPFKCRIVVLDGYLEEDAYAELVDATSFYVNASNAEGLCLPLMEFMALGKPAIAPRHTALEDYIDPSAAFIVSSSPEHNVWPNDPRQRFHTMRERIHWDTLVEAYEESYRAAKTDIPRYRAMAARASDIIRDYSGDAVIREQLRIAIAHMPAPADAGQAGDDEPDGLLEAAAQ